MPTLCAVVVLAHTLWPTVVGSYAPPPTRGSRNLPQLPRRDLVQCPTPGCNTPLKPSKLAAHLLKCPVLEEQRALEATGFWDPGVNAGEQDLDGNQPAVQLTAEAAVQLTAEAAAELELRLLTRQGRLFHAPASAEMIKVADTMAASLGANERKRRRHRVQRDAIVQELGRLDCLGHGVVLIECGAGNGELSLAGVMRSAPAETVADNRACFARRSGASSHCPLNT